MSKKLYKYTLFRNKILKTLMITIIATISTYIMVAFSGGVTFQLMY